MAKKVVDDALTAEVVAQEDVPFTEHEAPVETVEHAPLELVTDPGMKKVIVFAADEAVPQDDTPAEEPMQVVSSHRGAPAGPSDSLYSIHAGVDSLGPDPSFPGRPRGANLAPIPFRTSRTVYRTESGSEVRSYESGSRRNLTLANASGEEVAFRSEMVDQVVGTPAQPETTAPQVIEVAPQEEKARRRFGFFGRRKPKPEFHADGKGDPSISHVYQTAVIGEPEPAPAAAPEPAATAWDPGQGGVVFHDTPVRVEVKEETWKAPRPAARRPARPARKARKAAKPARKVRKAAKPRKPKTVLAYAGDNHPIIDIEGIGPTYAKRLEKAGIATTGQLAVAKAGKVAKTVKAPKKTVKGWQAQADLLKVKGVGPQYAEAMARAGIRGIDDLKSKPADKMAKTVTKYLDSLDVNVVGQPVTAKRMAKWKRTASHMRKVKVDKAKLAVPDHGIPPPWLRDKGKGAKKAAKKAGRKKR
ncbi:MAG: DUF4332 domain-containing protein [bacterium]